MITLARPDTPARTSPTRPATELRLMPCVAAWIWAGPTPNPASVCFSPSSIASNWALYWGSTVASWPTETISTAARASRPA